MFYYRRYVADYLRDTMHLSMLEDGAYNRLLDVYYSTEKPLPGDLQAIFRATRARSKQERRAIETVLHDFFHKTKRNWVNLRAKREIKKKRIISTVRTNAAKSTTKRRAFAEHLHIQMPCKSVVSSHKSNIREEEEKYKGAAAPPVCVPPVPAELWLAFVEMRKKIRKPMTEHAARLVCRKLERLAVDGEDLIAVVEQSIVNDWQSVFPVRQDRNYGNGSNGPKSKEQLRFERSQVAVEQATGHRSRLADALRADLPRGNNAGTGAAVPERSATHPGAPAASCLPGRSQGLQVPTDPSRSDNPSGNSR